MNIFAEHRTWVWGILIGAMLIASLMMGIVGLWEPSMLVFPLILALVWGVTETIIGLWRWGRER